MNHILLILLLGCGAAWAYFLYRMAVSHQKFPPLSNTDTPWKLDDASFPLVSIIIPARNEENNLSSCLDSLLRLDYPNTEIIIVNDRSTDNTQKIADHYAKESGLIRAIHLTESADGWTGKNFACHSGVQIASGDWLLFTDADTIHYPLSLKLGLNFSTKNKNGFLSLLSQLNCKTLIEKIIQPIASGLLVLWYPLEKLNDPSSPLGFANGQYMLFNKNTYAELGGHKAVKDVLLEDVALSERAKKLGIDFKMQIGTFALKTRMYHSFASCWKGWKRIFIHLSKRNPLRLLISSLALFGFGLLPFVLLLATFLLNTSAALCFLAFGVVGLAILGRGILNKLSRLPRWPALLYPISVSLVLGILVNSFWESLIGKQTEWRGQKY